MVYQSPPTSIPFGKAIPRKRKEDRRVGLASRGPRERWCRVSSRVGPHGYPGSRCGIYAVPLLGGQPWMPAMTLLDGRARLRAQRMAMVATFREPSLCRPVHRELWRNAVLDLTPIIPTTACYQRIYAETYSRFRQAYKNKTLARALLKTGAKAATLTLRNFNRTCLRSYRVGCTFSRSAVSCGSANSVRVSPQPQPHPQLSSLAVSDNAEGGRIVNGSKVEVDIASPFRILIKVWLLCL